MPEQKHAPMPEVPGWPGLNGAGPLLPPADIDFAPLRAIPVPGPRHQPPLGWRRDPRAHLLALAPEFAGQPMTDLLLAAAIVDIRRATGAGQGAGLPLFTRLLEEEGPALLKRLTLRWLRSVSDTLADHGTNPATRAVAMTASSLVTLTVAAETERKLYTPRRPWPPRAAFSHGGLLFDGLRTFHSETGDMLDNFAARLETLAATDDTAGPVLREIHRRLRAGDTVLYRLSAIQGKPLPPTLGRAKRRLLAWLTRRFL
ncbi:hypothetical protein [Oceanibium sediminis]|uniref:hypothetical protein n=1 Tax=Oceanibium sediminis TaxID=2026339 RepID=UPI000DD2CD96|nr:hypothetical protein [Oceanibium sediminis]